MSDKPSVREYFPQRPDESAAEYEYRLFRDFGICAEKPAESKEKAKPLGTAVFLLTDPSVELLTSIRDLLAQLVTAVGASPVAEAQEDTSATAGTETPVGIDTSPLVVHKTAALQDAISARDAVFFRLRNLATQPITEYSHEQLARMGEEMGIKQAQVHRCTEHLEKARAAEVARGGPDDGPGKFSNRRRPGTRFSNPTPPAAPETPDAAQ